VNYHSKHADWIKAARLWRQLGVQVSPEYLDESWENISKWKNKRPGCSPALEREGAESEGNQQTAVANLSHELDLQSTSTPNRPLPRAETEGKFMGLRKSQVFPKKYLKVDDLNGHRVTVIIDHVKMEEVGDDEKPVAYFEDNQAKPLVLNLTNWSMIEEIARNEDTDKWVGVKIVLYPSKTDFNGKRVPCIRIDYPKQGKSERQPGDDDDVAA
jgi:hypothetical protein